MLKSIALAGLMAVSSVLAQKCSEDKKCPESAPCCGQYGDCGVGAFCLGGCNPRTSFSKDSCMPNPVCQDKKLTLDSLDNVADISTYLGDAKKADFVSQGEPTPYKGSMLLTMPKGSVGTVLSTTEYMWYGNVKARMKTARGRGVVTAFILFSDVQDEIDYEWVGVDLETAQTNFYFQGIPNYENSENLTSTDSFKNYHDYEIQWTPDQIQWIIDGKVGRTVKRSETFNKTSNQYEYPQTPARIQFSIWPGGDPKNAEGTIAWAGGEIDWSAPDIQNVGYFYATVESLEIECYAAKSGPGTNSGKAYWYDSLVGTNDTVKDGDRNTVLASFEATGEDPEKGKKEEKKKDKESKTDDDKKSKETKAAQIPGGGSAPANDHSDDDSSKGGNSGQAGGEGSSDAGDSGNDGAAVSEDGGKGKKCDISSFHSDCDGQKTESKDEGTATRSGASAIAVIIAMIALISF